MKPYEDAIHSLTVLRSNRIREALLPYYDLDGEYGKCEEFKLFRDGMPSEFEIESRTAHVISTHLGITHPHIVQAICDSYHNYGYHCIVHAVSMAIIVQRLGEIYLPDHPALVKIAVLGALLHDSYHTHGALPDTDNVERAKRFTTNLISMYGAEAGYRPATEHLICTAINTTLFMCGTFPNPCPEVVLPPETIGQRHAIVVALIAEADLMMSATPYWPSLASVLAHDFSRHGNDDYLEVDRFCATQCTFITHSTMDRLQLKETRAAMSRVRDIHSSVVGKLRA